MQRMYAIDIDKNPKLNKDYNQKVKSPYQIYISVMKKAFRNFNSFNTFCYRKVKGHFLIFIAVVTPF